MERETEKQLMMLLKGGDEEAFNTIYEAYKLGLGEFLKRKSVGEEDIEDILQEVFVSLWENRATLEVADGFLKGYLIGAVRNRCYSLFRSTQAKTERHVLYEQNKGELATDEQARQELCEVLQQQLDLVADDVGKMVFNAAFENEEKPKDIAARFGIKTYTVRRILFKIRLDLKKYFNR